MDTLDFLDGQEPEQTPVTEAPAEPAEGPARGPDGKFVPKEQAEPAPAAEPAQPDPTAEQQPEPTAEPAPTAPPPGFVPLQAVHEAREKARQAEERLRAYEAQQAQQPQYVPDRYEDPEGYEAFQAQQIQGAIYQQNLTWSRRIAELAHTPEKVAEAHEWGLRKCDEDPFFNQRVASSQDPYGVVMEEWKREQLLQSFQPADYDEFLAWKAGRPAQSPQAATAAPISQSTPPPPRSIASQHSAGGAKPGEQPVGPGVSFDAVFK